MPLMKGKSEKAFKHNVEAEMHEGKPQKQSLAIAYSMKRKAKKMAEGGFIGSHQSADHDPDIDGGNVDPQEMLHVEHEGNDVKHGSPHNVMNQEGVSDEGEGDMNSVPPIVMKIMMGRAKGYSHGGEVANDDEAIAGSSPNEFDDLALRDDLEEHYTGANSGDELSDEQEDHDRHDIVSRILKSRAKKDRNPVPA